MLNKRIDELGQASTHKAMLNELSRFLDPEFFDTIQTTGVIAQHAQSAIAVAQEFLDT